MDGRAKGKVIECRQMIACDYGPSKQKIYLNKFKEMVQNQPQKTVQDLLAALSLNTIFNLKKGITTTESPWITQTLKDGHSLFKSIKKNPNPNFLLQAGHLELYLRKKISGNTYIQEKIPESTSLRTFKNLISSGTIKQVDARLRRTILIKQILPAEFIIQIKSISYPRSEADIFAKQIIGMFAQMANLDPRDIRVLSRFSGNSLQPFAEVYRQLNCKDRGGWQMRINSQDKRYVHFELAKSQGGGPGNLPWRIRCIYDGLTRDFSILKYDLVKVLDAITGNNPYPSPNWVIIGDYIDFVGHLSSISFRTYIQTLRCFPSIYPYPNFIF
ncbi:MAG: hypothetical protein ACTSU9_17935 [Promethearchaeota archaeon]